MRIRKQSSRLTEIIHVGKWEGLSGRGNSTVIQRLVEEGEARLGGFLIVILGRHWYSLRWECRKNGALVLSCGEKCGLRFGYIESELDCEKSLWIITKV